MARTTKVALDKLEDLHPAVIERLKRCSLEMGIGEALSLISFARPKARRVYERFDLARLLPAVRVCKAESGSFYVLTEWRRVATLKGLKDLTAIPVVIVEVTDEEALHLAEVEVVDCSSSTGGPAGVPWHEISARLAPDASQQDHNSRVGCGERTRATWLKKLSKEKAEREGASKGGRRDPLKTLASDAEKTGPGAIPAPACGEEGDTAKGKEGQKPITPSERRSDTTELSEEGADCAQVLAPARAPVKSRKKSVPKNKRQMSLLAALESAPENKNED